MKRTLLVGFILLALSAVAILWLGFDSKNVAPPPPITLRDGTVIQFDIVTTGTNHHNGTQLTELIRKLPGPFRGFISRFYPASMNVRSFTSTETEMWIWFNRLATVTNTSGIYFYYDGYLADDNGFISGDNDNLHTGPFNFNTDCILRFKAWPRRSRTLQLHLYERSNITNSKVPLIISFRNPDYVEKAPWTPESLPATKTDGDLKVTLESFRTGLGNGSASEFKDGKWTSVHNTRDGPENESVGIVQFEQGSTTNAPWEVTAVKMSDPGGNVIGNTSLGNSHESGEFSVSPALWPDEPAWKLQLEVKRYADFATNEIFVFKDVPIPPVGQSNYLALSTNIGRTVVTLTYIIHKPPLKKNSWTSGDLSKVGFTNSALPKGLHLDLVSIKAHGKKLDSGGWRSSSNERQYQFREFPTNVTTFDITMALHRSRTVEFMVKPEVASSKRAE